MARRLPLAFVAAALVLAGCTSTPEAAQEAADNMQAAADLAQQGVEMQANASASSTSASANTTANASEPEPQYDYGNCMRGMDMPGCPQAVAEKYFDDLKANQTAPPPDKELPPILVPLDPQGAGQTGAFELEAGTMQMLLDVYVNETGETPWLVVGPGPGEALTLQLTGPSGEAKIMKLTATGAGAAPAKALAESYRTTVVMPEIGAWTLEVLGQGTSTQVDIHITERFYM